MKNLFVLLASLLLYSAIYGQQQVLHSIYLHNGDLIRGYVLEDHSPDSILINSKAAGDIVLYLEDIKTMKTKSIHSVILDTIERNTIHPPINAQNQNYFVLLNGDKIEGSILKLEANKYFLVEDEIGDSMRIAYEELNCFINKPAYLKYMEEDYFEYDSLVSIYTRSREKFSGAIIKDIKNKELILKKYPREPISIPYSQIARIELYHIPYKEWKNIQKTISPDTSFSQWIYLKNGDRIKGELIGEDSQQGILFRTFQGDSLKFSKGEVRSVEKIRTKDKYFHKQYNRYTIIGAGSGVSYGVVGLRFQQRFGRDLGFGYHIGGGLKLDEDYNASLAINAGFKCFVYRDFFMGVNFGNSDPFNREVEFIPAIMAGADLFLQEKVGLNFAIAFSFRSEKDAGFSEWTQIENNSAVGLSFDVGMFFKIDSRRN